MSALWTAADVFAATGARATGAWTADGVSIDTRSIGRGDLFVALRGPTHDGHDHVAAALAAGAAAAMVHRRPPELAEVAPLAIVGDTLAGLTALGRAGRERSTARIAAVTGSVGKTGTKEALRHVLARQGAVHASAASHNNHWGVPLTLARMPHGTRYGVIELGMNHAGEIAALTALARPHVAMITRIAPVHLGHFASIDAIADAKAEIFEGLEEGGVAVLNRDDEQYGRLCRAAERRASRIVTFGSHPEANWRLVDARLGARASEVDASGAGATFRYRLSLPGAHQAANSIGVLAVVAALGADPSVATAAFADLPPLAGRGRFRSIAIAIGGGEATLLDESYNANPASMLAAIDLLGQQPGRRIAVLGDMLELGAAGPALHRDLAEPLDAAGVDLVFTCGSLTQELNRVLPRERVGDHKPSSDLLADAVRAALRPGDVVLVKGSLGSRMAVIVDALTRDDAAATEAG